MWWHHLLRDYVQLSSGALRPFFLLSSHIFSWRLVFWKSHATFGNYSLDFFLSSFFFFFIWIFLASESLMDGQRVPAREQFQSEKNLLQRTLCGESKKWNGRKRIGGGRPQRRRRRRRRRAATFSAHLLPDFRFHCGLSEPANLIASIHSKSMNNYLRLSNHPTVIAAGCRMEAAFKFDW